MMSLLHNVVRQLNRTRCSQMVALLTLVGSCLLGQADVVNAAVLTGGVPDPTFNGNSMQLWLRADQGVTASTTFTWADQSTHGNDSSQTGSARPTHVTVGAGTIGGLPTVEFDGVNDSLLGSFSSNLVSNSFTGFVVYHTPDAPVGNSFHPFDSDDAGNRFGFASYFGNTTQEYFLNFNSQATSGVALNTNPILISTVGTPVSTNTIAQDLNGTNILTSSFAATTTTNGYRIGSRFDGAGGLMDGNIAELIIYDEELSSEDYNSVGFYLQNKYGLSGAFTAPVVAAIPEPSGLALVLLGGSALMLRRRRRQSAKLRTTEI